MNDRSVVHARTLRPSQEAAAPVLPPGLSAEGPRRRILEAALRLFAERGFYGASIRDIVQLASMQASAVYAHFASKEHVLAELARAGHEAHLQVLQASMLECGVDPVEQLRAYVHANARFHLAYPHIAKVVNAEMHALSGDLVAPALAVRGQSAQLLLSILERGAKAKRFVLLGNSDDPAAFARALYVTAGAIGAMALRLPYWFPTDGTFDARELANGHVELAVRMVGVVESVS